MEQISPFEYDVYIGVENPIFSPPFIDVIFTLIKLHTSNPEEVQFDPALSSFGNGGFGMMGAGAQLSFAPPTFPNPYTNIAELLKSGFQPHFPSFTMDGEVLRLRVVHTGTTLETFSIEVGYENFNNFFFGISPSTIFCPSTDCGITEPTYIGPGTTVSGHVTVYDHNFECALDGDLGVEGVEVTVFNDISSCTDITDDLGHYECEAYGPAPYDICISEPTCTEECGLSALDIVEITRLNLGIEPTLPIHYFIADVNCDGIINKMDEDILRDHLLQLIPNLADAGCGKTCFFIAESKIDDGMVSGYNCSLAPNEFTNTDFVRTVLGDMNGTCSDCEHGDGDGPFPLQMSTEDGYAAASIPPHQRVDFLWLEFILEENPSRVALHPALEGARWVSVSEDRYILSWSNTSAKSIVQLEDQPLIQFVGLKPSQVQLDPTVENLALLDQNTTWIVNPSGIIENQRSTVAFQLGGQLVDFEVRSERPVEYRLFNIQGYQVHHGQVTAPHIENLSGLSVERGMYILQIWDGQDSQIRKIFY